MTVFISFSLENFDVIFMISRAKEKVFFLDDKSEQQCKCAVAATSHSCSFCAFSSALVAILVSLEQRVN